MSYLIHIKSGYIPHFIDKEDKVMYPRVDSQEATELENNFTSTRCLFLSVGKAESQTTCILSTAHHETCIILSYECQVCEISRS